MITNDLRDSAENLEGSLAPVSNSLNQFPLSMRESVAALLKGSSRSRAEVIIPPLAEAVSKVVINDAEHATGAIFATTGENTARRRRACITAAKNGAALIITSDKAVASDIHAINPHCGVVLCSNTSDSERDAVVRGLRPLAERVREAIDLPVLSISGTSGKTTSRDLTTSILKQRLSVNSTRKNDNNIWGTTVSLLSLTEAHDCAMYEFGSDGKGQTRFLASLTKPTVTYTSSIGVAHVSTVGGIEEMLACETEQYDWMIQHSPTPPIFIANMDDPHLHSFFTSKKEELEEAGTLFTVSSTPGKHEAFQLLSVEEVADGDRFYSHVSVATPYGLVTARVPLIGRHNHANICGAIALALGSGCCGIDETIAGLENPTFTGNRSEFFREPRGDALILNDSFNSNPTGLTASVRMLVRAKELLGGRVNRLVLALGDMHALGEESPRYHREMGEMARRSGVAALYCHGQFAAEYCRGFGEGAIRFEDKESLYETLVEQEVSGSRAAETMILVKGSPKTKTSHLVDWFRAGK